MHEEATRALNLAGGVCQSPYSDRDACLEDDNGIPPDTYNPEKCGCVDQYLKEALDGSWVCIKKELDEVAKDAQKSKEEKKQMDEEFKERLEVVLTQA